METKRVLKAIADETRFKILRLLLQHNYCVRALSKRIGLSESAVSQHLKILKDAGLLAGEKKGYYMHYNVERDVLTELASEIKELAALQRKDCDLHEKEKEECKPSE
jgi:ArsR family transcriptional regulator